MENKKIDCARVFVKFKPNKNVDLEPYYNFYVRKEEAEEMYLYVEGICNSRNMKYDLIGYGRVSKAIEEKDLVGKEEIYKALTSKEYDEEEELQR